MDIKNRNPLGDAVAGLHRLASWMERNGDRLAGSVVNEWSFKHINLPIDNRPDPAGLIDMVCETAQAVGATITPRAVGEHVGVTVEFSADVVIYVYATADKLPLLVEAALALAGGES